MSWWLFQEGKDKPVSPDVIQRACDGDRFTFQKAQKRDDHATFCGIPVSPGVIRRAFDGNLFTFEEAQAGDQRATLRGTFTIEEVENHLIQLPRR